MNTLSFYIEVVRALEEIAVLWQQLLDQARADIATRPPA